MVTNTYKICIGTIVASKVTDISSSGVNSSNR